VTIRVAAIVDIGKAVLVADELAVEMATVKAAVTSVVVV
jgi:hypothetical protein